MKTKRILGICFAALMLLSLSGCSSKTITRTSTDSSYSIEAPDSWEVATKGSLNSIATLELKSKKVEKYMIMMPYNKTYFSSFEDFCEAFLDDLNNVYSSHTNLDHR